MSIIDRRKFVRILITCAVFGCLLYAVFYVSEPSVSGELLTGVVYAILFAGVILYGHYKDRKWEHYCVLAARFRSQLENGRYFSSPKWQEAYRKYRDEHPIPGPSFRNMHIDLARRRTGWIFREYGLLFFVLMPCLCVTLATVINLNFNWYVIVSAAVASLLCEYALIFCLSLVFSEIWFSSHPEYADKKDSVRQSYASGAMFECAQFCLVIGKKYIHGFDGKNFYTVPRANVRRCGWIVECTSVFHRGRGFEHAYDEYMFRIRFSLGGSDAGKCFSIPLDQFQIKTVMDSFFSDVSVDSRPKYISKNVYSILRFSLRNRFSAPIPE